MGIVLLDFRIRDYNIALEFGIGNLQKFNFASIDFTPRKFRPEAHPNSTCNSIFNGQGVITFKNHVRLETDSVAEFFTNIVQLLRTVQPYKACISQFITGKKPGRGAYVCPDKECITKAYKAHRLERALDKQVNDDVYKKILEEMKPE